MKTYDQTIRLEAMHEKIQLTRSKLAEAGIQINANSSLNSILCSAEAACTSTAPDDRFSANIIIALTAQRLCESLIYSLDRRMGSAAIMRLCRNSVDLSAREKSQGKDALFELELLAALGLQNIATEVAEPDLVATIEGERIGIACKKIYSEKKIHDRLRHGYRQITNTQLPGIVAFNLDDLLQGNSLLQAESKDQALAVLERYVVNLVDKNTRTLGEPIARHRCDAVLFSLSYPCHIPTNHPSLVNVTYKYMWTIKQASSEARRRTAAMAQALQTLQIVGPGYVDVLSRGVN